MVRTGFDGGIDIIFGNVGFGMIPKIGEIIQVNYIETSGAVGNIFRRTFNDWKFIEDAIDGFGRTIDPTKIFDISIYTDINFGADKENLLFTRNILPIVSNNFVLGLDFRSLGKVQSQWMQETLHIQPLTDLDN